MTLCVRIWGHPTDQARERGRKFPSDPSLLSADPTRPRGAAVDRLRLAPPTAEHRRLSGTGRTYRRPSPLHVHRLGPLAAFQRLPKLQHARNPSLILWRPYVTLGSDAPNILAGLLYGLLDDIQDGQVAGTHVAPASIARPPASFEGLQGHRRRTGHRIVSSLPTGDGTLPVGAETEHLAEGFLRKSQTFPDRLNSLRGHRAQLFAQAREYFESLAEHCDDALRGVIIRGMLLPPALDSNPDR